MAAEVTCPKCGAITPVFDSRQCGACQAPLPEPARDLRLKSTPLIEGRTDATNQLRYILNELRAMDTARNNICMVNEELPTDRASVIDRLHALAGYLERGGETPDAYSAIGEATRIPIQR